MSLSLKDHISGNFAPGDTLNFAVTASDFYNNTGSGSFTVTVEDVTVGTPFFSTYVNTNTNEARNPNRIVSVRVNHDDSGSYGIEDSANNVITSGTLASYVTVQDATSNATYKNWQAQANQNIPSGSYTFSAKLINNRSFTGSFGTQQNIGITQSPP